MDIDRVNKLIEKIKDEMNYPPAADPRLTFFNGYIFGLLVAIEDIKKWAGVWDGNT